MKKSVVIFLQDFHCNGLYLTLHQFTKNFPRTFRRRSENLSEGLFSLYSEAMFTLHRIGFCSVSKVAPVQCEQELMFCCGAEIVPKRSQCEQKPYPSHNLQRCLLI